MNIECLLDYASIVAGSPFPVHLAVRCKAATTDTTRTRPIAFCPVLDRSGSMSGAPLDYARQAAQLVVKHLRPADYFGLVVFNDEARTVIPMQQVRDKSAAHAAIEAVHAGGSTNLCGGLLLGGNELAAAPSDLTRKMLLLSDGHLNVGITDPDRVAGIAAGILEQRGIRTSCLGFGANYAEAMLSHIARRASGAFYDASTPEKLPAIFQSELEGLMSIASQNVRLRLKPLDFCHQYVSLGALPGTRLPDGRWEFHVGDLVSDEERWSVFFLDVLSLPNGADGRPVASLDGEPLMEVEVLWDEIEAESVTSHSHTQTVRIQAVQRPEDVRINTTVLPWVASQRAGKAVEDALHDVRRADLPAAERKLSELREALGRYGHADHVRDGLNLIERTLRSIELRDTDEHFHKRSFNAAHFHRQSSSEVLYSLAAEEAPSWSKKHLPPDPATPPDANPPKRRKR
jgi:Ca-activated chloride channel family protein